MKNTAQIISSVLGLEIDFSEDSKAGGEDEVLEFDALEFTPAKGGDQ